MFPSSPSVTSHPMAFRVRLRASAAQHAAQTWEEPGALEALVTQPKPLSGPSCGSHPPASRDSIALTPTSCCSLHGCDPRLMADCGVAPCPCALSDPLSEGSVLLSKMGPGCFVSILSWALLSFQPVLLSVPWCRYPVAPNASCHFDRHPSVWHLKPPLDEEHLTSSLLPNKGLLLSSSGSSTTRSYGSPR